MQPFEYEKSVAYHFTKQGYKVKVTPQSGDWGVDVFLEGKGKKIAVQVKMYGGSTRRVNRQMIMELHGAKDYFDCDQAILATDGQLMPDAESAARKLKIEIFKYSPEDATEALGEHKSGSQFDDIWQTHIMPLKGREIRRANGATTRILDVDWGGVTRITSNKNEQHIEIEIFRKVINHLIKHGSISRGEINQEYAKRASSGIVLILSQAPNIKLTGRPMMLNYLGEQSDKQS